MHRLGWVPDVPDRRDHMFSALPSLELPPKVDLRAGCAEVIFDQGPLGSCTANAIGAALQFCRIKQQKEDGQRPPSRLFIYYLEREKEGTLSIDAGAMIRDGVKSVKRYGTCFEDGESAWPYDAARFTERPPQSSFDSALGEQLLSYQRIDHRSLRQLRSCLAQGYPFVFGFSVYESFESASVEKTGLVPMPSAHEQMLGGHAVLGVGYDDEAHRFIVRNSWGSEWGDGGYCYMPYAYLTDSDLSDDFWRLTTVE